MINPKLQILLENLIGVSLHFKISPIYPSSELAYESKSMLPNTYLYRYIHATVTVLERTNNTVVTIETQLEFLSNESYHINVLTYVFDGSELKSIDR